MSEQMKLREEKILKPMNGIPMLLFILIGFVVMIALFIYGCVEESVLIIVPTAFISFIVFPIMLGGLKVINPNEAAVYTLFGSYYGTINKEGFYWLNPFCAAFNNTQINNSGVSLDEKENVKVNVNLAVTKKVSLKAMTLNNEKQKVNDSEGNPIEIGVIVIWKVINATKAVFEVDNYIKYISTQCDASIRQVARQYPYDISDEGDEKSLRGSAQEVALELQKEIQKRVEFAGIEILEARIAHLAYAPEIAAAMLQRQQASAIIAARQKIVEGAVGMVEMALKKLSDNNVVELDDERKAQMVSNLLVVLCGNKDAQPIVNSGTIY
ncbi:SPFH domain-containing protein [Anaerorhabdus furcosa]|uniref:SPFH domain / Band 7 family protein n=1 Tax=Anaerorhabdus furcosa TaxID=118967 RepID=A0A1T4NKY1_9FIRM|nr:SPFH domain-containing protein [Anaerorhabdus furcosa]SJZ79448.1 SPFH domain / Band 7 family protein [Anaerorhabdus furcosa]